MLEELKKRCRGYLGQFFELVKPISRKYEMAVKVSLLPQLRYLLVDTVESARYVADFLKEKGMQKHVLVLENLPQRHEQVSQRVRDLGGEALSDVIDVASTVRNTRVRVAVDYYTQGKVVCADFNQAVTIQRQAGIKHLVTLEGTEFKSGQISGGQHTGLSSMSLGQAQLQKEMKQLQDEITKLEEKCQVELKKSNDLQRKQAQ